MASSVSAVIQKMEQNFASFAIEKDFKPHSKIHCATETDIKKGMPWEAHPSLWS
jgi:hypothetical protein